MSAVVQVFKADSKPPRRRGHSRQHTKTVAQTIIWSLDLCKRIFLNSYEKKIGRTEYGKNRGFKTGIPSSIFVKFSSTNDNISAK